MKKTILVRTNQQSNYNKSIQKLRAIEPPIWHAILANYYKAFAIVDAEAENYTLAETVEAVNQLKADRVIILATGSHPSAFIQQKEESIKLEKALKPIVEEVEMISSLPVNPILYGSPEWSLLDIKKYRAHNWHLFTGDPEEGYGVVYTSLGCPMKCSFCTIKNFYGRPFEERSIDDIMADFEFYAVNNIKNIKIMDELFVFKKQRVIEICKRIADLKANFNIWTYARIDIMDEEILTYLKKAGVNWLAFGVETGNDNIRKNMLKGSFDKNKIRKVIKMTHDANIQVIGNYMFGFWEDTYETMRETLDFAKELNCAFANFYCVSAFPGTPLYDDLLEKKIELPTKFSEYSQMNEEFKPLPTATLTGKDVLNFRDKAFKEYFSNVEYLNSIKDKFGITIANQIIAMNSLTLKRKHS